MSFQIWCGSWCQTEVSRISSMCLLRIRRCLVSVTKEMPCLGGGSPCFHDLVSRRWSHAASLCQTLPVVSSQDLVSVSWVISDLDVQSHSYMALWSLFFMIWKDASSVCIHLSTWVWRVWVMTISVVVYPMSPISFVGVHGWLTVLSSSFHAVLYPCLYNRSNISRSRRFHGDVTKYVKLSTAFGAKTSSPASNLVDAFGWFPLSWASCRIPSPLRIAWYRSGYPKIPDIWLLRTLEWRFYCVYLNTTTGLELLDEVYQMLHILIVLS
jgi:hypothetical protein